MYSIYTNRTDTNIMNVIYNILASFKTWRNSLRMAQYCHNMLEWLKKICCRVIQQSSTCGRNSFSSLQIREGAKLLTIKY
jgi:hypothetical protein